MMNRDGILKLVKGLLIAYCISIVLLLLQAFAIWKWDISEMVLKITMIGTYIVSNLVGGFYIGKKQGTKKFLWGILLGLCYVCILFLISVTGSNIHTMFSLENLTVFIICILSAMLGGMFA